LEGTAVVTATCVATMTVRGTRSSCAHSGACYGAEAGGNAGGACLSGRAEAVGGRGPTRDGGAAARGSRGAGERHVASSPQTAMAA